MFNDFYKNKKVLVTGHSGFKGSWLSLWLHSIGAEVIGYSLKPETTPSLFETLKLENKVTTIFGDIKNRELLKKTFNEYKPEIVFHLAAQPLVRRSYFEPVETYETNVIGTLNVLEAARNSGSVKSFVNITTDKCYENNEVMKGYTEDKPMGGYDPYSASKACVEIMSASYRRSFLNVTESFAMATARSGNVIGGGDWSEDRLIPDTVKAFESNQTLKLRNPDSIRPWQHVLEPLRGYLILGERLYNEGEKHAQAFNFGPNQKDIIRVVDVVQNFIKHYGKGNFSVEKTDALHEANLLILNIEKANKLLDWKPLYSADDAIQKTAQWYKNFYNNEDMIEFTLSQIKEYGMKEANICV